MHVSIAVIMQIREEPKQKLSDKCICVHSGVFDWIYFIFLVV